MARLVARQGGANSEAQDAFCQNGSYFLETEFGREQVRIIGQSHGSLFKRKAHSDLRLATSLLADGLCGSVRNACPLCMQTTRWGFEVTKGLLEREACRPGTCRLYFARHARASPRMSMWPELAKMQIHSSVGPTEAGFKIWLATC